MKKIFLAAAIVLPLAALLLSPLFIKVNVTCKSQYGDCPGGVNDKLKAFDGKSITNATRQVTKTLKEERLVSDFSIQFKLPNILSVSILLKKPEFALFSIPANSFALVNSDGEVLSVAPDATLPKVVTDGDIPKTGEKVKATDLNALKLIRGVFEMYQIDTGKIEGTSLTVDLPGKIKVLFPLEDKDPQVLLGTLRLVYSRITTEEMAGKYSEIDLRFKNPVLR